MVLWRISRHDNLTGRGGEIAPGRWHTQQTDKRIVYLSEHPALALVENLVNLKGDPRLFPVAYQLMKIEAPPDNLNIERFDRTTLSYSWWSDQRETREAGDRWLASGSSALLSIPSVPSPESTNYLLNPKHPQAGLVMKVWSKRIDYDRRLLHLGRPNS